MKTTAYFLFLTIDQYREWRDKAWDEDNYDALEIFDEEFVWCPVVGTVPLYLYGVPFSTLSDAWDEQKKMEKVLKCSPYVLKAEMVQ